MSRTATAKTDAKDAYVVGVRLSPALYEKLHALAHTSRRTPSAVMRWLIENVEPVRVAPFRLVTLNDHEEDE